MQHVMPFARKLLKASISMKEDEEGFEYPEIDKKKYIKCYMRIKVCAFKSTDI